jgi:hypothetical protein
MVRFVILVTSVVVSVFGLLVSNSPAADTTVFRVTSYIPQYFKDFELQTSGQFDLSRNDELWDSDVMNTLQHTEQNVRHRSAGVTAFVQYKLRTIKRFLNAQLHSSGSTYSHHVTGINMWHGGSGTDSGYSRQQTSSYSLSFEPRVEVGSYIAGDAFLALNASASASYTGYPTDRKDFYSREFGLRIVDDVILTRVEYGSGVYRYDHDSKAYLAACDFRTGWGRMYDGSFAVTGMEFINELRKAGLIAREPSYSEMMRLAEIIHHYRQTHAVDTRLHRIDALTEILTQLADAGVVTGPGPYGFALVEDVWDYYPRSKREFGWQVSVGVGLSHEHRSWQSGTAWNRHLIQTEFNPSSPSLIDTVLVSDEDMYDFRYIMIEGTRPYLGWQAEYSKPLSPRWQVDGAVVGRHYLGGHVNRDVGGGGHYSKDWPGSHQIAADILCAYYYDTRTAGGLTLSYETGTAHAPGSYWGTLKTEKRWVFSIGGDVTYRLSVPTSMQLRAGWSKEHDLYAETVSSYNLSAGITHWLF